MISLALMIVYIFAAFKNGQIVHIDSDRIYRLFPHDGAGLNWSSVREVGVVGLKVLGNPDKKHTGSKYIYFSDHAISEEELFQMCLKWPPEDILYIRFSYKRIAQIQRCWAEEISMFNTGNLQF